MKKVLGEDIHEISPTVGFNIKTLEYNEYLLNLWDVGGQKSIRAYWRNYFEQTDGIIWVIDSVDRWRLEECKNQLRELLSQEVRNIASSILQMLINRYFKHIIFVVITPLFPIQLHLTFINNSCSWFYRN